MGILQMGSKRIENFAKALPFKVKKSSVSRVLRRDARKYRARRRSANKCRKSRKTRRVRRKKRVAKRKVQKPLTKKQKKIIKVKKAILKKKSIRKVKRQTNKLLRKMKSVKRRVEIKKKQVKRKFKKFMGSLKIRHFSFRRLRRQFKPIMRCVKTWRTTQIVQIRTITHLTVRLNRYKKLEKKNPRKLQRIKT